MHKNGPENVHWLKDRNTLPARVPNSRIIAYNYESRWHADAPRTRLELCGEDLMNRLYDFRDKVRNRLAVFIGYSLGELIILHVNPFYILVGFNAGVE